MKDNHALSSLARSPEHKKLLEFVELARLSSDWAEPEAHGVSAFLSGGVLDNENGVCVLTADGRINNEYLVHLRHNKATCSVNLNAILALATAFIELQYEQLKTAINKPCSTTPNMADN